jgi:hypothetical protein
LKSPFILFESPTKCPDFELNSTGCPDFELLNSPECPFAATAAAAAAAAAGAGGCGGGDTLLTTTSSRAAAAAAAGFDTQTPIFPPFINPTKTQEGDFALYLRKGLTVYLIFSHQFCFWIIGFLWDLGKNVFFDGSESLISQPKNGIFFLL